MTHTLPAFRKGLSGLLTPAGGASNLIHHLLIGTPWNASPERKIFVEECIRCRVLLTNEPSELCARILRWICLLIHSIGEYPLTGPWMTCTDDLVALTDVLLLILVPIVVRRRVISHSFVRRVRDPGLFANRSCLLRRSGRRWSGAGWVVIIVTFWIC
jgi:hypothetical protein